MHCSMVTAFWGQSPVKQFLHPTPAHCDAVAASPKGAAGFSIKQPHDGADGIKQPPENDWV